MFFESIVEQEEIRPHDFGVTWDPVVPRPLLMQYEDEAYLAFYPREDPIQHDPTPTVAIFQWHGCDGAVLGPPNDEAVPGHRLWPRGLDGVAWGAEVNNSAWIAHLEKVNSVHARHRPGWFSQLRHFVLLFKESTFECLAGGYSLRIEKKPMLDVLIDLSHEIIRDPAQQPD
jgi:hypothetical protein